MEYSPFGENGKIIVSAPVPYPPLTVDGPNPQIARLLGVDLASSKSEMTSICQYLYHSWVLPSTSAIRFKRLSAESAVEGSTQL